MFYRTLGSEGRATVYLGRCIDMWISEFERLVFHTMGGLSEILCVSRL